MWTPSDSDVSGVGLIVRHESNVIIVQETEDKLDIGKISGMFSFPMETRHEGESLEDNMRRLLAEELGNVTIDVNVNSPVGYYQVVSDVWLLVCCVELELCDANLIGRLHSDEVCGHRWISIAQAIQLNLRQGAREPLQDVLRSREGPVVCCECRVPPSLRAGELLHSK